MAGHSFMWVRSLPRAQGLHRKRGVFGPVVVGACGGQARPQIDGALAYLSGSSSKSRPFWACYDGAYWHKAAP